MNIPNPIIIPKSLTDTLDYYSQEAEERCWRIRWRGKFLSGSSKKTSWKTESAARAALFNILNYGSNPYFLAKENGHPINRCWEKSETNEFVKVAIETLEKSGEIEIVEL